MRAVRRGGRGAAPSRGEGGTALYNKVCVQSGESGGSGVWVLWTRAKRAVWSGVR